MPHLRLKTAEERNPESLLPPPVVDESEKMHPNAKRFDDMLAKLHPSKRRGYIETAYARIMRGLGDDNEKNYIPADQLASLISKWLPDLEASPRQIHYLERLADAEYSKLKQGEEELMARQSARSIILSKKEEIKKLLSMQGGQFF